MIKINNLADCCGCTACASICNHDAITMEPDALGFLYPMVDESKCVECGLCEKVCAFNDLYLKTHLDIKPHCFAARLKDTESLRYSRSGGVFVALSDEVLKKNGVIYGAGYEGHFVVTHKRATQKEERDEFRGSKYVQSDMQGVFSMVRNDLRDGKAVLFSGTPCQTAGLFSYVGNRLRENLILVDIICHAVPSPQIWKDYLRHIEENFNSEVISVEFRDKSNGWFQTHQESFFLKNGENHKDFLLRFLFYCGFITRPSCSKCHYTNLQRPSDITIGDYWGYEKTVPEMNKDNKGISIVICNTKKGLELLNMATPELILKSVRVEDSMQDNLSHPTPSNPLQLQFVYDYNKKGFLYVAKKYGNWGARYKIKNFMTRIKNKFGI